MITLNLHNLIKSIIQKPCIININNSLPILHINNQRINQVSRLINREIYDFLVLAEGKKIDERFS